MKGFVITERHRCDNRHFQAEMIGLPDLKDGGVQLGLGNRGKFVLLERAAIGLSNELIETFLVNIFFTKFSF